MILLFELNCLSKNYVLENLIDELCSDFKITYKIARVDNTIKLFIEDEIERLEEFSDYIPTRLPLSIFLKSTIVEVVEEILQKSEEIPKCLLNLPFTPKALLECRDNLSPFVNNEIGASSFDAKNILLKDKDALVLSASKKDEFDSFYTKIAQIIDSGEEVYIDSISGKYCIGKVDDSFSNKDFIITATDFSLISKMIIAKENELKALVSLEKPIIKFRLNSIYKAKNILPNSRVKVQFPDELLLQNICERLNTLGVDFIYRVKEKSSTCRYSIEIDGKYSLIPKIEVSVLENGEILILNGNGYSSKQTRDSFKKFDIVSHAQFASVMQEHNLFEKGISCFYLSKTHDDLMMHFSQKLGMLELVKVPVIKDMKEIFNIIESTDIGRRLVANYKKHFRSFYDNALSISIPDETPNSIYSVWGIISVVLGMSEKLEGAAEKIIEFAEDFSAKKGPKIDYVLHDKTSIKSDLNMIEALRTAMSYRLAGVEDMTLSFGIVESCSLFLSTLTDSNIENLSSEGTVLCGSLFASKDFAENSCKHILPNSKIYMNIELPIDH